VHDLVGRSILTGISVAIRTSRSRRYKWTFEHPNKCHTRVTLTTQNWRSRHNVGSLDETQKQAFDRLFSSETNGAWWPSWSSKPVARREARGGFDSHPSPPYHFIFRAQRFAQISKGDNISNNVSPSFVSRYPSPSSNSSRPASRKSRNR